MAGTRAAIRYAKAVLSLATDNKQAATVQADMTHNRSGDCRQRIFGSSAQKPCGQII